MAAALGSVSLSHRSDVAETETSGTLRSLTNRLWRWRTANDRVAQQISQQHGLNPLIAHILAARGITSTETERFLNPKLRDYLPDPFTFQDMDKAATRITTAIQKKEKIALFGDYDVDGATSSSVMACFLRSLGLDVTIYIPDRLLEGYGPNVAAFDKLIDDGHNLIITLDCGVLAFDPIKRAAERQIDVVVLDHHMASADLPPAHAIVNPNRLDDTSGCGYLCAAGVTFVTLVAVCQKLRAAGITPPDLLQWLDLVALGTVCDVVPMTGLNRALVAQGLKIMAKRGNIGLTALSDRAGLDQAPTTYHAGFVLGPRLNAGGRLSSSSLGATLLSTTCAHEAVKLADILEDHNRARQDIEKQSVAHAIGMVANELDKHSHMILVGHDDWHPGVIGLIAARLKENFQRPACVVAFDATGKGKASGRSITGIDLGRLILLAREKGLLLDGGGHAMAAGFSVTREQMPALHDFFQDLLKNDLGPELPPQEILVDADCALGAVTLETVKALQQLEPYGPGYPSPNIVLKNVLLQRIDIVKEKHLRLTLSDTLNHQRLSVMMFQKADSDLHRALMPLQSRTPLHILGSLKLNSWQGRQEAQFIADDIAIPQEALNG